MNKQLKSAIFYHENKELNKAKNIYEEIFKNKIGLEKKELEILYVNYANILFLENSFEKSISYYKKALKLNNLAPITYFNLGVAYLQLNILKEAIESFNKAITFRSDYLSAFVNLGVCYKRLENYELALQTYKKAALLNPNDIDVIFNYSNTLYNLDRFNEAIKGFKKVIFLDNTHYKAYYSLGIAYLNLGKYSDALFCYEKAIELKPDYADAHFAKSNILLLYGDYKRGFEEYEYRWEAKNELKKISYGIPTYDGEDLTNKSILIQQEQGFGDNIQFIRFLSLLLQKGAKKVYCAVKEELKIVFENSFEQVKFVSNNTTLENVDYFCSLITLAKVFDIRVNNLIINEPYLKPLIIKKEFLNKEFNYHIAFVWQGNKEHKNDKNRSINIRYFKQLFKEFPNIAFYSLQLNEKENFSDYDNVFDYSNFISNFNDTAQIVERMNLIISIDSSLAHLCGALNKKTWLVLPFVPDFRWMIDTNISPWYSSLKLYRQDETKNYSKVFKKIKNDLQKEINKY
ncbi:tetratricopeptide repeat protein [Malaciobacter marinus]|uniref:tetratricopeptide repeat protein n=1 Tax=Malaciobacter marinus TaxID=505249 RepID=UPI003B006725